MYETQQEDLLVGQMVGGYRVEQLLSKGRVSAVYLARHSVSGVPVAVTAIIIPEDFSVRARNRFIRRFTQIATALLELDHPHILPIYDFGEQLGYPYLISPYVTDGSLAHVLKRDGRCAPSYALEVLQQVATGLDYAHARGIVHRALKPANIVLQGDEHHVIVAGFGLVDLLQLRGVRRVEHPYLHLLNLAGTFLGSPEYLAPEVVLGQQQVDARADIYALGIILYELLSGKPPFTGSDSLEIALQHVKQPVPALRNLCPSLPPEIDEVLSQALARDPSRRFPSAGAFVTAYARALRRERSFAAAAPVAASIGQLQAQLAEEDELTSSGNHWQLRPPIITGHLPSIKRSGELPTTGPLVGGGAWQDQPLPLAKEGSAVGVSSANGARREMASLPGTLPQAVPPMPPAPPMPVPSGNNADLDSFAWWSGRPEDYAPRRAAATQQAPAPASAAPARVSPPAGSPESAPVVLPAPGEQRREQQARSRRLQQEAPFVAEIPKSTRRGRKRRRRQVVALLAGGGLAAAGLGLALKTSAAQSLLSGLFHSSQGSNMAATSSGTTSGQQQTGSQQQTNGQTTNGTKQNGKVIGTTALALNSAQAFTNPADGKQGLLIHLPAGSFAAYSRSCTHEGVAVNYDPATHLLVCPAHGAIFDPAKKGSVVQGPATTPLPQIMIRVNADGSITTV